MKKENKILKDEQGNDIASPRLSDNPSEEGEVKVSLEIAAVSPGSLQGTGSGCRPTLGVCRVLF